MRRELVKTERRRGLRSGTPGRQRRTNNSARLGVEVALAQGGIAVPGGRGTLWVSVGSFEPQRDGLARCHAARAAPADPFAAVTARQVTDIVL